MWTILAISYYIYETYTAETSSISFIVLWLSFLIIIDCVTSKKSPNIAFTVLHFTVQGQWNMMIYLGRINIHLQICSDASINHDCLFFLTHTLTKKTLIIYYVKINNFSNLQFHGKFAINENDLINSEFKKCLTM